MAPFQSSKQRAYLYAKEPEVAAKFEAHSSGRLKMAKKKRGLKK